MSARKHRSEAEWQVLIAEQLQSGQSALAFCREHGTYAKTFYKQRQAQGRKGLMASGKALDQVNPAPVRRQPPHPGPALQYQGSQLQLLADTDPMCLAALMKTLP